MPTTPTPAGEAYVPPAPTPEKSDIPFGTCDHGACSSTAYVEVRRGGSALTLAFCGHHFAAREAGLFMARFHVSRDARHLLRATP